MPRRPEPDDYWQDTLFPPEPGEKHALFNVRCSKCWSAGMRQVTESVDTRYPWARCPQCGKQTVHERITRKEPTP